MDALSDEDWQAAHTDENSRLHLIKSITLDVVILKCFNIDTNELRP